MISIDLTGINLADPSVWLITAGLLVAVIFLSILFRWVTGRKY